VDIQDTSPLIAFFILRGVYMKFFVLALVSLLSLSSHADEVSNAVKSFHQLEFINFISDSGIKHDDCYPMPDRQTCVKYACSRLSTFECDDQDELEAMFNVCKGNFGDRCLKAATSKLNSFEYNEFSEISELAVACSGFYDVSCIDYVCQRIGHFKCDERSELIKIINQCK